MQLARLFCLDNYGVDGSEYNLHPWGKTQDLAGQYAFNADARNIDHSHYLLWAEDTLTLIAAQAGESKKTHSELVRVRSCLDEARFGVGAQTSVHSSLKTATHETPLSSAAGDLDVALNSDLERVRGSFSEDLSSPSSPSKRKMLSSTI